MINNVFSFFGVLNVFIRSVCIIVARNESVFGDLNKSKEERIHDILANNQGFDGKVWDV